MTCCDIYGNAGGDWTGAIAGQLGVADNFSLDPLFCDTADGDYHINSASPCAPANSGCGELIGALGVACSPLQAVIVPDLIYAFEVYAITPGEAAIFIGNFEGDNGATDVNLSSIMVNGTIVPASASVHSSYPGFEDAVVRVVVTKPELIQCYEPSWDSTAHDFAVSGQFADLTEFIRAGSVTLRSHRSGDVNLDGEVNVADVTFLTDFLFRGGRPPAIVEIADLNCEDGVNLADLTFLIAFLFTGGPEPENFR